MFNGIQLSTLSADIGNAYGSFQDPLMPYVYFSIGVLLACSVIAFAVEVFWNELRKQQKNTGYFTGTKNGLVRDKDQALGKMQYDVQTKGVWIR